MPPRHRTRGSHVRKVKESRRRRITGGMIATLWIFLALAASRAPMKNGDSDVIRKILGTFNDQLAR